MNEPRVPSNHCTGVWCEPRRDRYSNSVTSTPRCRITRTDSRCTTIDLFRPSSVTESWTPPYRGRRMVSTYFVLIGRRHGLRGDNVSWLNFEALVSLGGRRRPSGSRWGWIYRIKSVLKTGSCYSEDPGPVPSVFPQPLPRDPSLGSSRASRVPVSLLHWKLFDVTEISAVESVSTDVGKLI